MEMVVVPSMHSREDGSNTDDGHGYGCCRGDQCGLKIICRFDRIIHVEPTKRWCLAQKQHDVNHQLKSPENLNTITITITNIAGSSVDCHSN